MENYHEVKCPNCGTAIKIDDAIYNSIAQQVKDEEFNNAVARAKEEIKSNTLNAIKLAESNKDLQYANVLADRDNIIANLKNELAEFKNTANKHFLKMDKEYRNNLAISMTQITELKERVKQADSDCNVKIQETIAEYNKQIAALKKELELANNYQQTAIDNAVSKERESSVSKDVEIVTLRQQLDDREMEKQLAIQKAINIKDKEIADLQTKIATKEAAYMSAETSLKEKYETLLKSKEEEVKYYKDFKSKQSVKLLGESLESHCFTEYSTIRPLLPTATFDKDNTISNSGSKGDFIFRDFTDGEEYISIMFEMKNESDDSLHKHKNEDYLKELDKDRREKDCEYAVLVTMLESDNELYNRGIVDMSHKYEKMFIIRPQFFVPLIILLRNASLKGLEYKLELERVKSESIDVTTFEADLINYKTSIHNSVEQACKKKDSAIAKIDKVIASLQQIKEDFITFNKHLNTAGSKAEKLTIKKLTANAPSVATALEKASIDKETINITSTQTKSA